MLCSISGTPADEPVVSRKSGHVFEKRAIKKIVAETGKCPVTEELLTEDDLIEVKTSRTAQPRPAGVQSLPALLTAQQNEWDAVMLENFHMKKQLDAIRQELSHALYQHDAACRVIARLILERDEARNMMQQFQLSGASAVKQVEAAAKQQQQQQPQNESSLPSPYITRLTKIQEALRSARKKRQISTSLAKPDQLSQMGVSTTGSVCQSTCTCMASTVSGNITAYGTSEGSLHITASAANVIQEIDSAHKTAVNRVVFTSCGSKLISGSKDGLVKVWQRGDDEKYSTAVQFADLHTGVVGLSIHPHDFLLFSCGVDGSWNFYDIQTNSKLASGKTPLKNGFSEAQFHPDGLFVVGATADGGNTSFAVLDIKQSCKPLHFGDDNDSAVTTISLSQNGLHLAAGYADGSVKVWNLGKFKCIKHLKFADNDTNNPTPVRQVSYDFSGCYLSIAARNVKVFDTNSWGQVAEYPEQATAATWGTDALEIRSVTPEGTLHIRK
eukprot:TRINITY_DN1419_c3_g1_i1.p1 TRINITY_DN1419_c3_g1~~TRINITY_DN1419_c3_g1_i1.p1  ORF type:complete len:510 (+),score=88.13 TRINITY_DN1419_c3_g1_i1:39-1532(+)